MANKTFITLVVLLGCVAAASAWCQQNYKYETNMVTSTLRGRGCYKTFLSLAKASGLYKALPGLIKKHKLTLLIPNDAAFSKLSNSTLSQLASKPSLLNQILALHAQRGIWNAAGLEAKPLHYQFTSLACYMSAKVDHYNNQYASPSKYCAFGGPAATSDPLAKDMYYSDCVSLQGLSDVIVPGSSFYQTCNYPGK